MTPVRAETTPAVQAAMMPAVQVVTTLVQVAMTPVRAETTPAVQAAMDLAQVFTARQMQMDSKLVGMKPQIAFRT